MNKDPGRKTVPGGSGIGKWNDTCTEYVCADGIKVSVSSGATERSARDQDGSGGGVQTKCVNGVTHKAGAAQEQARI